MRLSHVSTRLGNAVLDTYLVDDNWAVRFSELALAGNYLPSGIHDHPIVDIDV